MKILIVDDSLFTLNYHKELIEKAGLVPLLADSGEKALALYKAENPEIVLCDIMMPEMNGYEVFELLKEISSDVFLYFISAEMTTGAKQKAISMKAAGFYQKPISAKEISEILEHYRKKAFSKKSKA